MIVLEHCVVISNWKVLMVLFFFLLSLSDAHVQRTIPAQRATCRTLQGYGGGQRVGGTTVEYSKACLIQANLPAVDT